MKRRTAVVRVRIASPPAFCDVWSGRASRRAPQSCPVSWSGERPSSERHTADPLHAELVVDVTLRGGDLSGENLVHVADLVPVALLSEEELTVHGEVLVFRLASHERIEVGLPAVLLRPQDPAESLRLLDMVDMDAVERRTWGGVSRQARRARALAAVRMAIRRRLRGGDRPIQ